jgi:deoxycytidine triphosphate deaminase
MIPLKCWTSAEIEVTSHSERTQSPVNDMLEHSDERVALDLHVGDDYQVDFHDRWLAMPAVLRPNDCVRIRVDEDISTPLGVFGQVCSKGGPSSEGLLVANQKVDPNFSGRLELSVFNAGNRSVMVEKGLVFASLWFDRLDPPLTDGPKRQPARAPGLTRRDWRERWHAARPHAITGIISVASVALGEAIIRLLT